MDGSPRERAPGPESGHADSPESAPRWQELADAVWLSAHWIRAGRAPTPRTERADTRVPATDAPASPVGRPPEPGPDGGQAAADGAPLPLPDPEGTGRMQLGRPVLPRQRPGEPAPGGVPSAQLARALHRLARQVPSHDAVQLDEEATAERGVSDELWMPWFRPADATAFDLVLLVDDAPTMAIWGRETAGLHAAAEHSGAFRAVRTVKLVVPRAGKPSLRWGAGRTPVDPGEILNGRADRVFLVITDGLGHGWAGSAADQLLERLGRAGPTAIVHLLPPHLRRRSSLHPYQAALEAGGFGASNTRLRHREPVVGSDPLRPLPDTGGRSVPVPVLSLKPDSLAAWADLVVGERGVRRDLPVAVTGALAQGAPAPGLRAPRVRTAALPAVRLFLTLATPKARRLATQLAVVPLEFDLVDQLRRRTMPETGPDHLAEILMGGLIDWDRGGGHPEFADGVREALLATTTRSQLARTVAVVGALPAAGERGVALRAALHDPTGTTLPDPGDVEWRRTELAVMRALSGPYAERARRIEADADVTPAPQSASAEPVGSPPTYGTPLEAEHAGRSDRTRERVEASPGMESKVTGSPALLVNVPLRNTSFVGRQALLRAVEEQLGAQDTAAVLPHALHGMGGVGKSQLALEYIYTHMYDYEVICWVSAERESLILSSLATLAAQLGITPAGQDIAANMAVPAALEALRTGVPHGNWLLVFDNAEDVDAVRRYFPANGPGKVIVTSRNRAWERVATPLPVDVFERAESVELLQKRSPDLTVEDADRLAEALGDLPLAVEQAGAWRAVTGMLVDEYLDLLGRRSPEILELDPAPDYPVSVAAAWDISLEHLQESNPGARQLLDVCANMAPEPIPRSMLRGSRGVTLTPEIDPLLRESIKLNRAIRDLSQFSLIKVDPRSDTVQMHRMLQTVLLAKLPPQERERMRDAAHQLLSAAKPGNYASSLEWREYQALLPHLLTSQAVTSTDTWVRELIHDTALFLYYWGDYQTAVDLARQAWTAWLAASGEEDIHVIRITKIFAFLLRVVGQVAESIPLTEQALAVSRRIDVAPEDLVDSLCAMADARRYGGRFEEARDLGREATELARSRFGADDPTTLWATHSLAVDLRLCGQFREAMPLDQENARMREQLFGPANFFTLNTLNALSTDMRESGDYPGSRDFQEDVYRRARAALGEDNPLTLRIARNLAVCRRRDGALAEGARLSEETLRRFVVRYGPDDVDSLATAINLSVDLRLAGDLDRSRRLAEETTQRYARLLGERHAFTLLSKANTAATLRAFGALDAARELEDDAARLLAETVGSHHVTTLTVELGRANTVYARLDFERACEIDEAGLPKLAEAVGEHHPLTLACTANLALDLRGLGRGAEADELQRTAVDGFTRVVRSLHPWLLAARQRRRIECDLSPMPL
ncbi:FxSxx-COOH system tetratricopeptide repeat protein [Streptomyces sp. NPDC050287]|uniref:FxSxx-COOH system tetratricopeptide repeat protein n=1 Tax=Streptomyces sp. NPDC050287 TaxID=3365608 RepID=UPI0037AE0A42